MRTRPRLAATAFAFLFALLGAATAHAAGEPTPPPDAAPRPKSVESGLYMTGYSASFTGNYESVTVTVSQIRNESSTRTTGTLKIEYWASLTQPPRGETFRGYRLATFNSIPALEPRTYYENLVRSNSMVVPPDGTYWFVLILLEYDPANCSASDGFCMIDNVVGSQRTFGNPPPPASASNYSDLWWNPLESGWGLTIADHQTQIFAVWYTYRADGSPTWFVLPGGTFSQGRRLFTGDLYETSGPPYTQAFDSSSVTTARVGSATIDFAPPGLASGSALFSYSVGAVSGSKQIQRQPFGNAPSEWGSDLTDIYYDPAESGWGLAVTQHGNDAFAVWYTYDEQRRPLFIVMPGVDFSGSGTFTGDLYTTTGPYFGNATFDPSRVRVNPVGSATVEFDPVQATTLSLKSFLPRNRKKGKFRPRVGGAVFNKWISPQRYGYSAPDTPPPACEILYYEWSPCANGMQYRSERTRDPAGCSAEAELSRACTPENNPPPACTYQYTAWGSCQPGNYRSRTVTSSSPAGCVGTPTVTEACTYSTQCSFTYGNWGACVNGVQNRSYSASPPGCTGTPVTSQSCSSQQLPPGFPTNVPLGLYRLDISVCATLVGCINSSQTLQNADVQAFASQLVSILNASALGTSGCSSTTSYTGFNGSSFTATLTTVCGSGSTSASSTVTIRVTKL